PAPALEESSGLQDRGRGEEELLQVVEDQGSGTGIIPAAGRVRGLLSEGGARPWSSSLYRGPGAASPVGGVSGRVPSPVGSASRAVRRALRLGLMRISPLQGLRYCWRPVSRGLPWAGLCRPFRARGPWARWSQGGALGFRISPFQGLAALVPLDW